MIITVMESLNLRLIVTCDVVPSHASAGAAAGETSSESEEEEVEQRPESTTDLSLEYLQIKKLVKYMKVDVFSTSTRNEGIKVLAPLSHRKKVLETTE